MEEVLNNLQKIKEFRVLSRNSVEQFRNNTTKSTPEIAKALGVNYFVEGSGQKYGNTFRVSKKRLVLVRLKWIYEIRNLFQYSHNSCKKSRPIYLINRHIGSLLV
jgi:hypothetical protein